MRDVFAVCVNACVRELLHGSRFEWRCVFIYRFGLHLNDRVYGAYHFVPGAFQFVVKPGTGIGKAKILAGRAAAAFYPPVSEHSRIFQACEEWVQCAFQQLKIGSFHFFDDVARVGLTLANYRKHAKLQDSLAHLAGCVFYVHCVCVLLVRK